MRSLLDSADPVMSLLGNLASVGRVGSSDAGGVSPSGGTLLSPTQRSVANDSLLAAGAALANAGAARFGPQPTLAQGLTQGLLAGSIAGQSAQERANNQQQAQQILAQSAQDAELRRKLIEQHLNRGDLVTGFIKSKLLGQQPADQAAPSGFEGEPGARPGDAIRDVLRGREQDQRGYGSVNAGNYTGAFQLGSDLAADAGFYMPADTEDRGNQWRGSFKIAGHPDVRTRDDFLRSGPAQEQAFTLAAGHIDKLLRERGIYDRVAAKGGTVNGQQVTRDGLIMGAWLKGVDGLTAWVDRGVDGADGNGTRVSQYVQRGSQASTRTAPGATSPAQTAPAASAPPQLPQNVPLVPVASPSGVKFTVAPDAADAFTGFLTELEGMGYKLDPAQSGGYARRTIAGTGTPSEHAYGRAIDVNWHRNARGENTPSDLPPNVGQIAAKYGLVWGGDWKGADRDPMHFEYKPKGVQVAEGGARPTMNDASGTAPAGASRPQAARQDILAGATQEQLIGILMSDDPAKALMEFANKPPHTIKDYNPSTGQMEVFRADNNNRKIGPPIAREAPTFEHHQEVIGNETRWVTTIPGTAYRQVGGVAPREIKQVKEWDAEKKQTLIWNLGADGKKMGEPIVSNEVPERVPIKGPNGQPWVGYVYPGQPPVPVAEAPTPPELAPKTKERADQEYRQSHPYTPAEMEYEKELGKKEAAMLDAGTRAATTRNQIQAFLALQNDLNTGVAAEKWGTVGQWLDQFGLGDKTGIPGLGRNSAVTQPAMRAIRQQLVQSMMSGPDGFGHNQISDADLKTLQGANLSIGNDPEANRVIGSLTTRFLDKQEAMRDAWTDKLDAARQAGEPRPRFDTWVLREWKKDPRNVELLPTVKTPEESQALPPGTVYRRQGQRGVFIIPEQ